MINHTQGKLQQLEDLPNIGKSIAADLRAIGIQHPDQLARVTPLSVYNKLEKTTGHRHDPCVLYTLLSARHYLDTGESRRWWEFIQAGKRLLKQD